jgi:hypothetical protein
MPRVRRGDLQGVLAAEGRIAPWGPHVGPSRHDPTAQVPVPHWNSPGLVDT